jgi:Arc/MetJ family transcription regulator
VRTVIDVDDEMLARAQRQLGTKSKRDTVNEALALAAGLSEEQRARALTWLQDHVEEYLDLDFLIEEERAGR